MDVTVEVSRYLSPKEIENYSEIYANNIKNTCFKGTYAFYGTGNRENWTITLRNTKKQIIGIGSLGIYTSDTRHRCDVWGFNANRQRLIWVDHIEVYNEYQGKGYGKKILAELEKLALPYLAELNNHRNIYVAAVAEALGFYRAQGYDEIETPEEPDDEDYIHVFRDEFQRRIMAKPMSGGTLENETHYFVGMDPDSTKFEHACLDSHPIIEQWFPYLTTYIRIYIEEDPDNFYYIFERILGGSSPLFFDTIYRHLMLIHFNQSSLETLDELKTNGRLVRLDDLATFFGYEVSQFDICPEIRALCDKIFS